MKKILLVLLVFSSILTSFQSCKKGENDPGISFRSRKARITGEWTLKEGHYTITDSSGTFTATFNGNTVTVKENNMLYAPMNYTQKVTIDKDGSYKDELNIDDNLIVDEGGWFFGDKSKELDMKSKEYVCFSTIKYTNGTYFATYTGLEAISFPEVWQIDRLANKELIIILDGTRTYSEGNDFTISGDLTYEQK